MDKNPNYLCNGVSNCKMNIVDQLFTELKKRGVSVPKFAETVGIPKDRIYKWRVQGTTPKAEDMRKIELWISDREMDVYPKKETSLTDKDWLERLDVLIQNNRTLTATNEKLVDAHIRFIEKINSNEPAAASDVSQVPKQGAAVRPDPVEYLDNKERNSGQSKGSKKGSEASKNK